METSKPKSTSYWEKLGQNYVKTMLKDPKHLRLGLQYNSWSASWEICMQVRKQQLELDMEQQTGSK